MKAIKKMSEGPEPISRGTKLFALALMVAFLPMQVGGSLEFFATPTGLVVLAIVLFAVGFGLKAMGAIKKRTRAAVYVVAGIVFMVAILQAVIGLLGVPIIPPVIVVEPFDFDLLPSVDTTGGDTIPAGNYDACDTEAGGTTAEWTTTEGTYDPVTKAFIGRVAIDTDLAITAALWTEPNCLQMSYSARLLNGRDSDGDGAIDAVSYFMRIVSVSRTLLALDNGTTSLGGPGFVRDGVSETNDWLLLYRTDASTWISACQEFRGAQQIGNACNWARVGDHAGGASDTFFAVVILEDRGLFGYAEPAIGSSVNIVYEFGSPSGNIRPQQFTLTILLNSRGTANLA